MGNSDSLEIGRDVPGCLTKIRALARGLEIGPLLEVEHLGDRSVGQSVRLVVSGDEVGHDSRGLEESDTVVVRVNDRWKGEHQGKHWFEDDNDECRTTYLAVCHLD